MIAAFAQYDVLRGRLTAAAGPRLVSPMSGQEAQVLAHSSVFQLCCEKADVRI